MKNSVDLDFEYLRTALKSLEKAYEVYSKADKNDELRDIYADSCVKRFEYTYETAWKLMKKYFKLQYSKTEEELTMNNIFRYMEGYGFTLSWLKWKDYNKYRNNTAHEYNIEKSKTVLEILPEFIEDVNFVLKKWDLL